MTPESRVGIQSVTGVRASSIALLSGDLFARKILRPILQERDWMMNSQSAIRALPRRLGLIVSCLALVMATVIIGAGKSPMRILKYDPAAEKMEMFAALDSGALAVRVVAHDAKGGNMFFENLSGKPLTVNLPEAVTIVHILKQFGGGGFAGGGLGGQQGGFGGQQGGFGGGAQSGGGGFGGQQGGFGGGGFGGQQGGGGGFFSIPPERVAQVPYHSVCLNYGKPDPSPRMTYKPVRIENYTDNKVLQETLRMIGTSSMDYTVAQAATWHITDKMSWEKLASLQEYTLPGVYSSQVPTFTAEQIQMAQQIVSVATKRAEERAKLESETKPIQVPPRSSADKF